MKQALSLLLALCLTLSLAVTGVCAVSESAKLETIQALGIMRGDSWGNMNLSSNVTRAEFVTMMTAASPYRDSAGGSGSSLFKDVKSGHWAVSYVKLAAEQGWMSGYTDGAFRPDKTITLEEGCTALLRLLGYGPDSFAGSYPAAQLNKANAVGLLDGLNLSRGQTLTRNHCVGLFYNLLAAKDSAGAVYGTSLGYTVNNGEVSYAALVSADTKGPFVSETGGSPGLPFASASVTVYRDGSPSALSAVKKYDVYYYNENMRTVWVYSGKATGTLTALSPSAASPTSATVAGVSYPIESSQASYKLSSQGEYQTGDLVTLLLGRDGGVVDVVSALSREAVYYGVVVSTQKGASSSATSSAPSANAQWTSRVACSDGVVRTFYHSGGASAGSLVTVTSTESGTRVASMPGKSLSGTVNDSGTRFAGYAFADGVEILDTDSEGGYARVYPARLAGKKLERDEVRCYTLNAGGEIDRLILREATGDTYSYIYITRTSKSGSNAGTSSSYTYLQNGETRSLSSGSAAYPANNGGGILVYDNGTVTSVRQLSSVKLTDLSDLYAKAGSDTYQLAENVQVILRGSSDSRDWYATTLSDIRDGDYTLTGWYDDLGCSAGGLLRIIAATPKGADTD